jgi:prevent-host-death family protein
VAKTISASFAKANVGWLLDQVEKGERISITRHNTVIAEIAPPEKVNGLPKFGTGKGKVKIMDPSWADPISVKDMF